MKGFKPATPTQLTDEEKATISALMQYPSLEKTFDPKRPQTVADTKKKLRATLAELERVVRGGNKEDAEKASVIARAYQTTIDFIGELEKIRENRK